MPGRSSAGRCCSRTSGTITSTRRPTSSTSTSVACGARSRRPTTRPCCTRCAAPGTCSVLTHRILRSSTFRLVLLYMALVSGSVLVLFGFIYWATAGFMDRQVDVTIEAEIQGLAEQYRRRGLGGLKTVIAERVARDPAGASVYLLVDADLQPVVGNLSRWPVAPVSEEGWLDFSLRERGPDGTEEHRARGRAFLLVGNLRLLVGRDVRDLEATRSLILGA